MASGGDEAVFVDTNILVYVSIAESPFHVLLYGIVREDVDYIMDTFPIVKRRDEQQYGEYRTKRVILDIYDEMHRAMQTGQSYQTRLNPPPADPRVAHVTIGKAGTIR